MPTAKPASNEVVTAALLVIGGEILSGRTKDQNIDYIAEYLTALGIDLKEVRVVGDEERAIVDRTQCAAASLHLCLHHRRDRADPQRHYRRLHGEGIRCADRH
jgi:molybdopterin biosynthesis enzyme MoaB